MRSIVILTALAALVSSAWAGSWNGQNNPYRMDRNFEGNFDRLPLEGELGGGRGWPSNYWPNFKGGIAHRWNSSYPNDFDYKSPSLAALKSMSQVSINQLSPAEKYDIFMGRYDYPTVKRSWAQTARHHSIWYGICHGMSPAALHYAEPTTVTLKNSDGIEITFFSSDVKALMGYYYAKVSKAGVVQIGLSCSWGFSFRGGCSDVNAGAFHIVMTNMLGLSNRGFIADIDRRREKWNHTAYKYKTTVVNRYSLSRRQSNGATQVVRVKTEISYAGSAEKPAHSELIGSPLFTSHDKKYEYNLELTSDGKIVDGEWVSADHPDYIWYHNKDTFDGYYSGINQIYKTKY